MNSDAKKAALACFIGTAIGLIVAILATPTLWWLGMLAGFSIGFFCHKSRETLASIPPAWANAKKMAPVASRVAREELRVMSYKTRKFVSYPRPFLPFGVFGFLLTGGFFYYSWPELIKNIENSQYAGLIIIIIVSTIGIPYGLYQLVAMLAFLGARIVENSLFYPFPHFLEITMEEIRQTNYYIDLINKGVRNKNLTYFRAYRWLLEGIVVLMPFLAWQTLKLGVFLVKMLFWIVVWCITTAFHFVHLLIRFIYSHERVLCGFSCAMGVAITYHLLYKPGMPLHQAAIVVLCGGAIGAMIGVIQLEIISKRVWGVIPIES